MQFSFTHMSDFDLQLKWMKVVVTRRVYLAISSPFAENCCCVAARTVKNTEQGYSISVQGSQPSQPQTRRASFFKTAIFNTSP